MDLMEQLLCPQVCMDVEDTPLKIEAPLNEPGENPEANLGSLPIELRARLILDNEFTFVPEQVPNELTPEEQKEIKGEGFSQVEYLKRAKLHCTVCNKHIGTSLVEQMDRYIHPELNTLMCQNCYKFYGTGEFEKDEDGSEIFCKWCGQGGNVMCCEVCPLVFCQLCVRRNLGLGKLSQIKKLDNWKCFKCDGQQISKFHITCHVLHEYTNKQLRAAVATRNMFLVKDDFSTCCTKKKRRKDSDSDDENDDYLPRQKMPKIKPKSAKNDSIKTPASGIVKRALNTINSAQPFAPQTNVFQSLQLQTSLPTTNSQAVVKFQVGQVGRANATPTANLPMLADLMPDLFGSMLPSAGAAATQPIRVQYQPVKQSNQQIHFVNPKPNMNTTWLNNACSMAKTQGGALIRETDSVIKSSKTSKSYADLANLHNRLQRAMAHCTNKLIVARKQMHKDFLKYLKTNHVSHSSVVTNDVNKPMATSRTGLAAGSNAGPASKKLKSAKDVGPTPGVVTDPIDLCDDDDDDEEGAGVTQAQIVNDDPLAISDDEEDIMVANNVFKLQPEVLTCDDSVDLTDDIPLPPLIPMQRRKSVQEAQNGAVVPLKSALAKAVNVKDDGVTKTSDCSRLTPKEYKRAISVRVLLSNEPLLDLMTSFAEKKGAQRENVVPDAGTVRSTTGFDFVREMQNVIESTSVRSIDGSPPLIPERDANASTPGATSPSDTPNPVRDVERANSLPGIDKALEAIKQLTESITETQTMDINSNDNVNNSEKSDARQEQNVQSARTVPPLDLKQQSGTNGDSVTMDGDFASKMSGDILNDTPPAICLEDMVKIYDACETTIDGDMVPAD